MTPQEKREAQRYLINGEHMPSVLRQKLAIYLGNGADVSGKKSLTYRESIARRDMYIRQAFKVMAGRPYTKCREIADRAASMDFGTDEAGYWLRKALDTGHPIPRIKRIYGICLN
ncbi:hypothetical protein [Methylomonas sp. MgM2]